MGTGIGSFMAVEGPARLPTRRTAKADGDRGRGPSRERVQVSWHDRPRRCLPAGCWPTTGAVREAHAQDPTRSAPASVRERRAAVTSRKTNAKLTVRELTWA